MPTPTPLTAQISGLGNVVSASIIAGKWLSPDAKSGSVMRACISLRSLPALNARPAPVSSTTATSGSSAAGRSATVMSSYSASSNALRTSGRSRVRVRTRLSSAICRVTPAAYASPVAVDPAGCDEHRGPALFGHHAVVLVPVVVRSAGRGERLAQQQAQLVWVGQPRLGIVRARKFGASLDGGPLPAVTERNRELGTRPQVRQ